MAHLILYFFVSLQVYADFEPWQGLWKGRCIQENYNVSVAQPQREMSLEVSKGSGEEILWKIQYEGEPLRNYKLVKADTGLNGHYVLDENNGILIDRFLINNELRDLFSVNGKVFNSTSKLNGNTIEIVTESFWANPLQTTSLANGQFEVLSFALRDVSRCILKK